MLDFQDCVLSGASLRRRRFLSVGGLALGGWTLADLLAVRAFARANKLPLRDKSVIFLFMHGGPSQIETFDPKMDAPDGIRSVTGEVKTSIPGVTFGGTFQRLARLADKFSVVRSFVTGDGNHDIKPVVGRDTLRANMGSLYSRIAGPLRPDSAIPTNIALFPRAVDPSAGPPVAQFGNFESAGELGPACAPFVPGSGAGLQQDMRLNLPQDRLNDRRALLGALDQWKRRAGEGGGLDGLGAFQQQAFDTLLGGASDAFDLSREDPRLVARYDTAPLVPKDTIRTVWKNHPRYAENAATLGRLLLLARRLCERGAGFVTVTTNFVWDMHADANNATMTEGMGYVGTPFDHAVSAFIEDVEARGLRDKILLVCCGEMGRTPRINRNGGRDHWGNLAPLMLYGGGLKMGQVIGQSSRDGGEPASNPVTIPDLMATIMHTLLDIGQVRVTDGLPPNLIEAVTRGQPIRGLA
ncbi:MAG: DUF1501 domain-containing protein [Verrucomicrobia bacterium]|nr:DUF1501 domain-containing protein [Verrucomicrobiota bacterium]